MLYSTEVSKKTRKRTAESDLNPESSGPSAAAQFLNFLTRHSLAAVIVLLSIATVRICLTYSIYNHTSDEPAHLGCGIEWLDKHSYQLEPQHPPLTRVMAALGPYLDGNRYLAISNSPGIPNMFEEGVTILYGKSHYWRTLTLSRIGILPFLWIGGFVVFFWAKRVLSRIEAVLAVFLYSMLPPILAHSGLATTDMGLTAFVGLAFLCGMWFLERPTILNAVYLGGACGLAMLCKFSAPAFLAVAFGEGLVGYAAIHRPSPKKALPAVLRAIPLLIAAGVVAALVIWAGYRFSYGDVTFPKYGNQTFKLPAPALFEGLKQSQEHLEKGHPAYMFGERSQYGFWYYYPVALAVKTPVVFLLLLGAGLILNFRKPRWRSGSALCFSLSILAFGLFSTINIGLRHVLPVYLGFSIVAAEATYFFLQRKPKWAATVVGAVLAYYAVNSIASHPDYLPYFNEFVGSQPETIMDDSDLDWGQDTERLARRLQEVGAKQVAFSFLIIADYSKHGFPPMVKADQRRPSYGWNAVSITAWKTGRLGLYDVHPEYKLWPDLVPIQERIGKGMLLYYFPPPSAPVPAAPPQGVPPQSGTLPQM
jgi:hypothetical protein